VGLTYEPWNLNPELPKTTEQHNNKTTTGVFGTNDATNGGAKIHKRHLPAQKEWIDQKE
jgi:hypothetical protein